jgi:hypothetical protein
MTVVVRRTIFGTCLLASIAFATPEYGRKTGKECNYCHPPKNYQLTQAGKYYREHNKSLKGYVPSPQPDANSKGNNSPKPTGHS